MLLGDGAHITNGAKEVMFKCLVCFFVRYPHSFVLAMNLADGRDLDGAAGACSLRNWV